MSASSVVTRLTRSSPSSRSSVPKNEQRGRAVPGERDARRAERRGGEDRLEARRMRVSRAPRNGRWRSSDPSRWSRKPFTPSASKPTPGAVDAVRLGVVRAELLGGDGVHDERALLDVAVVAEIALAEQANAPLRRTPREGAASLPQAIVDAVAAARLDAESSAEPRRHTGAEREALGAVEAGEVGDADRRRG